MTEQNDDRARRPERATHWKTRGRKNPFRLGTSCLALLLVTALLLVGGSLSQFYSGPAETENFPNLTAAAFGVTVDQNTDYYPGYKYDADKRHYVAYAFDVINESDVPVICNIKLNIAVSYDGQDNMEKISFYLCEAEEIEENAITNFNGDTLETLKVLSYDSETDGGDDFPFYLDARDSGGNTQKTFVLVMDCFAAIDSGMSTKDNYLYLSNDNPDNNPNIHAITVTAEQATEEVY